MQDDRVYGFNKADAQSLADSIKSGGGEVLLYQRGVGSRSGVKFFVARLNENMDSFQAECSIYTKDGLAITDTTIDAEVYDTTGFTDNTLVSGDYADVYLQDGKYYFVQAPCTTASRLIALEEEAPPPP